MRIKDLAINSANKIQEIIHGTESSGLRPAYFDEFVGQQEAVNQLRLMTSAAKARNEPVDHLLMSGPGGLGKTTLALMIATEMEAPLFATTAPTLGPEQLGKILSTIKKQSVVFIDEFHGLSKRVTELLYAAMEDGWIDVPTPVGPERRKVRPFTLVGATTNPGHLTDSMKERFGHIVELGYYQFSDMAVIVEQTVNKLGMKIDSLAATEIAMRARGIPRVANQHAKRIRDYAQYTAGVDTEVTLSSGLVDDAYAFFGIDELGLTVRDREYMTLLVTKFRGGPVGEQNLAIRLGMDTKTVAADIEPYLLRLGLVNRANRGRIATEDGRQYVRELLGEGSDD